MEGLSAELDERQRQLATFSRMDFLQELMEPKELENSTKAIEASIERMERSAGEGSSSRRLSEPPAPLDENERVCQLLQRKFKALENLTFALKKRVLVGCLALRYIHNSANANLSVLCAPRVDAGSERGPC